MAVSVCLSATISLELLFISSPGFYAFTCGRGSVLYWRRSDTLCISGFVDDVIFARMPRLVNVAPN